MSKQYKNKVKLEIYKEILNLFDDTFIDANSIQKMNYVIIKLGNKIKELEKDLCHQ
jgi:hypothetical protein